VVNKTKRKKLSEVNIFLTLHIATDILHLVSSADLASRHRVVAACQEVLMKKIIVRKPGMVRLTGIATTLHCSR